jgi:predicted kinase
MKYTSNEGATILFDLSFEEFRRLKSPKDLWRKMYKSYYVTYFGERAKAKETTDLLADQKIGKGDVVILDSTGVNTSKMLGYFKKAKAMGYTTSVVWLEIKPEYSVARDTYRGATEGRSVGAKVIMSYVPKIAAAYQKYMAEEELVDRILRFRWTGDANPKSGKYELVRDLKRYPRREQKQKMAAQVVAALLQAERSDLARVVKLVTADAAVYKGRKYKLLWVGPTRYGRRAKLGFWDGSREFWVDESKIQVQRGGGGGHGGKGRPCDECGRPGATIPCADSSGLGGMCCPRCAKMSRWERSFGSVVAKQLAPLKSKTGMRLREDLGNLRQFADFTDDAWTHFGNHVKKYGDTRIVFTGALQTLLAHAYRKGKALPMTEDYGVRWVPKASFAMKTQYANRYLAWLEEAGIVEATEMSAAEALKANHTKKDENLAKQQPDATVKVYVAGETLPGIIALLNRYGAKLGAVASAGFVRADKMSPEDKKPAGRVEFSTSHGDFVAVVGPVHPRWKVRPVELYQNINGVEEFIGYVAPAKMETIPRDRTAEGFRALRMLQDLNLTPPDPVAKPLSPSQQEQLRTRIRRHARTHFAMIQFFDQRRRWSKQEEAQYPNGTLFVIQTKDGMWEARYRHPHGTTTSFGQHKGPLAAVKALEKRLPNGSAKAVTASKPKDQAARVADQLSTIQAFYRDRNRGLWGIQSNVKPAVASPGDGWVWLGTGRLSKTDQIAVGSFLGFHKSRVPQNPYEWVPLQ